MSSYRFLDSGIIDRSGKVAMRSACPTGLHHQVLFSVAGRMIS